MISFCSDSQTKATSPLPLCLRDPDLLNQMWQQRLTEGHPFLELLIKEQADARCARRTRRSEFGRDCVQETGPLKGCFLASMTQREVNVQSPDVLLSCCNKTVQRGTIERVQYVALDLSCPS